MTIVSRRTPKTPRPDGVTRARILVLPLASSDVERVRRSRIETAKARIAAGFYDRLEVQDRLAETLIEELKQP
jgi:hypothetical protein